MKRIPGTCAVITLVAGLASCSAAGDHSTGDEPDCSRPLTVSSDALEPGDVPESMRLLWADSVAAAPREASAHDSSRKMASTAGYFATCIDGDRDADDDLRSTLLVESSDGIVERSIELRLAEQPGGDHPRRTLTIAAIDITVLDNGEGYVGTWWTDADAVGWHFWANAAPMTDDEIIAIVTNVRLGEVIDASAWADAHDNRHVVEVGDGTSRVEYVLNRFHESVAPGAGLSLAVSDGGYGFAPTPGVTRIVDIGGRPGLAERIGDVVAVVIWSPSPGVVATLKSDEHDLDELIAIAESIGPVASDDRRLTDAWVERPPRTTIDPADF
jgi:hypothetical protein